MIKYDKSKERWVVYHGAVPMASSKMLAVVKKRFPDMDVDESSAG
jgi:hypothetical protein